jgi:ubiquinol-cytochrome c reductase cytochrome b subunit
MGWLEGALRLMPNWETRIGDYTIPNPFYAGVVPAAIVFGGLYAWPWIERRFTKDRAEHHVLDRPRDRPVRTAIGTGVLAFTGVLGLAGSDDVLAVTLGMSVNQIMWVFRVLLFVLPIVSGFIAYKICLELQKRDGPVPAPTTAPAPEPDT